MADLEDHVDAGRRKAGDVLAERRLGKRKPRRARRQVLAQHLHAIAERGRDREAAIADDLERHALTDLGLGPLVERQREIGMRVDVDEPGCHDLPARVDHAAGGPRRPPLDADDATAGDAHVGVEPGRAGAVDHVTATNQQIVHRSSSPSAPWRAPLSDVALARSLRRAIGAPTPR